MMQSRKRYARAMTLREDIVKIFEAAHARIDAQATPRGVAPLVDAPDMQQVEAEETQQAIVKEIYLLADRIDGLEANKHTLA